MNANKIDINKTLFENNIQENSTVLLMSENQTFDNNHPAGNSLMNNNGNLLIFYEWNPNYQLKRCIDFITNLCKVPFEMIDREGICFQNWRTSCKSGPPGYLKNYFPPVGWMGIGLKVWNLYDNGDNTWLSSSNVKGEWYIAYHPIRTIESIIGILINGFRKGPYQECKYYRNMNPLTNYIYPECGEGAYFIPDISEVNKYAQSFKYLNGQFKVAFMCRINPYKVRIASIQYLQESWIVNGDALNDPYGRKRDDEVRPYKLLVLIEK
jgi:hypothetical protein